MYLTPGEAAAEIRRRRQDSALCEKVAAFLGHDLPEGMPSEPFAVLPRHVASCSNESLAFVDVADQMGLASWWPSYLDDRYTVNNPDKANYLNFRVESGNRLAKYRLVYDLNAVDQAKPTLGQIVTNRLGVDGKPISLAAMHGHFRQQVMPAVASNSFDISAWFQRQAVRFGATPGARNTATFYYPANLAFYALHAVMVEDWDGGPNAASLNSFIDRVLKPAMEIVETALGVGPLIVRLPWQDSYRLYPSVVKDVIEGFERAPKPPPKPARQVSRVYGW